MEENNNIEKIENIQENNNIEEIVEVESYVYSIMSGDSIEEYFSYELPTIDKDKIILKYPLQKCKLVENIMDKDIIEFYYNVMQDNKIEFLLSNGITLIKSNIKDKKWIYRTYEEAKVIIKDKVILAYQQIIPKLLNDMKNLEQKTKQIQQVQNVKKQNKEELLDFDN